MLVSDSMLPSFEHVQPGEASAWNQHVRSEASFPFLWHFHEEFELTLITAGIGTRFIGDSIETYEPGDLTFIGPDLPHTYASTPGKHGAGAIVMQFRRDFLGENFFDAVDLSPVAGLLGRAARALWFDPSVATKVRPAAEALSQAAPCERTVLLLQILTVLAGEKRYRALVGTEYSPALTATTRERIDAVCNYLYSRLSEPIDARAVADIAHLSPSAFSRFFRRTMGRTLTAYVNELRVSSACRLLVETDLSISAIAGQCGYENLSNFNRRFLQLKHVSPRQYRARFLAAATDSAKQAS